MAFLSGRRYGYNDDIGGCTRGYFSEIANGKIMDGRERLMLYLIRKYERHGRADHTCSLKQTRSQMAEEIGFSIKTMDRSIKKLEEDGMLRLEKGKIQVDQSGYLEMKEYIEQCIEGRS